MKHLQNLDLRTLGFLSSGPYDTQHLILTFHFRSADWHFDVLAFFFFNTYPFWPMLNHFLEWIREVLFNGKTQWLKLPLSGTILGKIATIFNILRVSNIYISTSSLKKRVARTKLTLWGVEKFKDVYVFYNCFVWSCSEMQWFFLSFKLVVIDSSSFI